MMATGGIEECRGQEGGVWVARGCTCGSVEVECLGQEEVKGGCGRKMGVCLWQCKGQEGGVWVARGVCASGSVRGRREVCG